MGAETTSPKTRKGNSPDGQKVIMFTTDTSSVTIDKQTILVIGDESVGKSALIAAVTGCVAYSSNFRGSTVSVHWGISRSPRWSKLAEKVRMHSLGV